MPTNGAWRERESASTRQRVLVGDEAMWWRLGQGIGEWGAENERAANTVG